MPYQQTDYVKCVHVCNNQPNLLRAALQSVVIQDLGRPADYGTVLYSAPFEFPGGRKVMLEMTTMGDSYRIKITDGVDVKEESRHKSNARELINKTCDYITSECIGRDCRATRK